MSCTLCQTCDRSHACYALFRDFFLRSWQVQIAGFIFGKNVASDGEAAKVAMTSPVTATPTTGGGSEKIAMTAPVTATPTTGEM
jgi:hypothetical protein